MTTGDIHWVVRLNRRNRTLFFALSYVVLGTHLLALEAGPWTWALLALQLLVYPQLVYWHAARARDPLRAEMHNLLLDGLLLGAWVGAWGLPLWISFMFAICVCLNVVIYMGMPGLWRGALALAAGIVPAMAIIAPGFRPDTGIHTSLLCIVLLTAYLLFFASDAYRRGISLRDSRRTLGERLDEITRLQAQLREQAERDSLTGLHNRRYFDGALERELAACVATGRPLSLVLIDIDHFKRINDTYGHPAGDEMIRRLADLLRVHARDAGVIASRYGGEEFLLMLPGTPMAEAAALAEALRLSFESLRVEVAGQMMRTTVSIGISGHPEHEARASQLVLKADHALYAAKVRGRNRTVLSTESLPATRALSSALNRDACPESP